MNSMQLTVFHYLVIAGALACLAAGLTLGAIITRRWLEERRADARFDRIIGRATRDFR